MALLSCQEVSSTTKSSQSSGLFWRGTTMDEVYQKLIDRTRAPLDLKQVKTIFGFSHRLHHTAKRGRERTEVFKAVQAASYDLTVLRAPRTMTIFSSDRSLARWDGDFGS